ncbi:hypothetical protein A2837_00425 [Candidatus Kaiserbacteria bacterium RIFCSPHIGHO2_01_FULL_46_22]|uniref:Tfp pilus assembly protein PilF n=1 Tax=Candidatus Kaiserbacteria bacterium RIFCSPHIGHO2_01_FULL_46_22 TaxID=1798475 RepID=A0A1F6BXD0_9BACT|nr:MAG: hypothetical protein A2837_00425 [Candidatus Kaiserbacteria bacterium RIFCSPHIGHO2_01_FULL_46_22]
MHNSFHPNQVSEQTDPLSRRLSYLASTILAIVFGLSPLLFLPTLYISNGTGKFLIVLTGIALAVFFFALAILREGRLTVHVPLGIFALWVVAGVTSLAAFFSGDQNDAFFGNGFESYTAAFTIMLALVAHTSWVLAGKKQAVIRLYAFLIFSALVLSAFHIARLFLGAGAMSFGFFDSATASPIGGWNGLAIFYGLIIILSLTALLQLPLAGAGRFIIMFSSLLALGMLAIINFTTIWYVLFGVSILILIYALVKNRWLSDSASAGSSSDGVNQLSSILMASIVALFAIVFIVGGARMGTMISDPLGVSFVEVRPSFMSTMELTETTFAEDLFFGAGPNRFSDVWRLHKDPSINQTIFWDTQFDTGYSYMLTSIIGTGLFGLLAWALFIIVWLWSAIRFLLKAGNIDQFWYFVGLSSLIASAYLWGMCFFYVPPPAILVLTALTTGIFLAITTRLNPGWKFDLSVSRHRVHGFALILFSVVTVSALGGAMFLTGKQILAFYEFNSALANVQEGDPLSKLEEGIGKAFSTYDNDIFAGQLAFYQLLHMRSLLQNEAPTAEDQQIFQDAAAKGVNAARLAVERDATDPRNYQLLGQIYSVLALVGVEGAKDRADESFEAARRFDPQNPLLYMLKAELALQGEDTAAARQAAEEAVRIRPAYTEALYLLTQLDINDGNIDAAINRTVGLIQLEPQNPARRYQLGVLLASADRLDEAIIALEQAVTLDPQYANARYFLAMGYAEKGRNEEAIEQLTIVRSLNESNSVVDELIERLRRGESLSATNQDTVSERNPDDGSVVAEDLEGGLVTTPNPLQEDTTPGEGASQ